jgi:hypothetical protein
VVIQDGTYPHGAGADVRVVSVSARPIRAACPTTCPEVKGKQGTQWHPTPILLLDAGSVGALLLLDQRGWCANAKVLAQLCKCGARKQLCEDVGDIILRLYVLEDNGSVSGLVLYVVVLYVNVLCARVVGLVRCEDNHALVVHKYKCGVAQNMPNLHKERVEEDSFAGSLAGSNVLGLAGQEHHKILLVGLPQDGARAEAECIARHGAPSVGACSEV